MSYLLDDVVRVLGSPMPRRKSFKLLGGMIAGGLLGTLGIRPAFAGPSCGFTTCSNVQQCCQTGLVPFCAPAGNTCCGTSSCGSGTACCSPGVFATCTPANTAQCCGTAPCYPGMICCTNIPGVAGPYCVSSSSQCAASNPASLHG